MIKKDLYLHIGYPKTGATTLQECVALNLKNVKSYIPNVNFKYLQRHNNRQLIQESHQARHLIENFAYPHVDLSNNIQSLLLDPKEEKIFISTVGILSAQFFKGHYTSKEQFFTPEKAAQRIAEVFSKQFNVKIIITIRRQASWIPSAYAEWYHYFSQISDSNTFKAFSQHFVDIEHFCHQGINYNNVIAPFEKKFGKNNLYIGVFEQLQQNPQSYFNQLTAFMGTKLDENLLTTIPRKNVRATADDYKKIDKLNLADLLYFFKLRVFPNLKLNFTKHVPSLVSLLTHFRLPYRDISKTIILSPEEELRIMQAFKEDNYLLSQRYDLDLDSYGYFKHDVHSATPPETTDVLQQ